MEELGRDGLTRRQALRNLGAAGLGLAALGAGLDDLIGQALAASPRHGSLKDIEHVVILMQENRSFDHYFGTLSGVVGFGDKRHHRVFLQRDRAGKVIKPLHPGTGCLPDLTHDWGPQHHAWHGGRMDRFVKAHEAADPKGVGPETMAYYKRADIPFYFALADAFTVCDHYHCSVIGPTDPNRLMSVSATIDPAGKHGGPLVRTPSIPDRQAMDGKFDWITMPERLEARGISWKYYADIPRLGYLDNPLTYFRAMQSRPKLRDRALKPTYPDDFMADLEHDRLPHVSWLAPSVFASEHPGVSTPRAGEIVARQVVQALVSHPKVWRETALFITWDENGGFFDHLAPPTPRRGTAGEFLTVRRLPEGADGIRGPIGLGFRVPLLVVSPFSRGGLVCSHVFDHTSTLRFLETRFRVRVPNLSAWRRQTTGDLTAAFNFAARPRYGRPRLPRAAAAAPCLNPPPMPVPRQPFPRQERGRRRRPSGP